MTIADTIRPARRPIHIGVMLEGTVTSIERVYAVDRLHSLVAASPRPICRLRLHLCADARHEWGVADCILVLDDETLVIAGASACNLRAAIDELISRLTPRLSSAA